MAAVQMPPEASLHAPDEVVAKALTEPMCVVADDPATWSDDEIAVYSEDRRYIVSRATGRCDCPDYQFRRQQRGQRCKHAVRAAVALGDAPLPAWANEDALDDQLRQKLETHQ